MASEENSNHYGVYVVFTSETLDEDKVVDKLLSHMTQVERCTFLQELSFPRQTTCQ